ncbi:glycosyltransferase [Streptomyces beihaiensis]|uniref:Glycosyltransferase n=1 Tax=Streptomyces beihaiensis TaxID=2984495 RepID=A0ABT3U3U8_9ACTN|nr:glycosyltransferase [Streptomyces beihaiensis]MCX3064007.1 glycosyltransferase [Streptomyces beihaiensis]
MNITDLIQLAHSAPPSPLWEDVKLINAVSHELAAEPLPITDVDSLVDGYDRFPCPPVTAAVLTRDEAGLIGPCLSALVHDAGQVLVIDSGSTDDTLLHAAAAHPQVRALEVPWSDDFAHHRNVALREIPDGWVMFVDADETLYEEDAGHIRRALHALDYLLPDTDLSVCPVITDLDGTTYTENRRILRAATSSRFRGRVHERPYDPAGNIPPRAYVSARFSHRGYTPEEVARKQKRSRNGHLLSLCREEEPANPKWIYYEIRDTVDRRTAGPEALKEHFARLATAVEALEPSDGPDCVSELRSDFWVLLCELALGFGGTAEVTHWADRLEAVGGHIEATYFRSVMETSRLVSRLSVVADRITGMEKWETPDNRLLLARLFELQTTIALACGRYELVVPAHRKATERGAGAGLNDDIEELGELIDSLRLRTTSPAPPVPPAPRTPPARPRG